MKERYFIINNKLCKRISRRTAHKIAESTDYPVYCYPVNASPASQFSCGIIINNVPLSKRKFYDRMYEFMYYNGNAQMGYYAAFYTPVEVL